MGRGGWGTIPHPVTLSALQMWATPPTFLASLYTVQAKPSLSVQTTDPVDQPVSSVPRSLKYRLIAR